MRTSPDRGATAVEYALMVAAISGVLVAVVFSLGFALHDTFEKTSSCFSSRPDNSRPC